MANIHILEENFPSVLYCRHMSGNEAREWHLPAEKVAAKALL
jgi:hypothetical protein